MITNIRYAEEYELTSLVNNEQHHNLLTQYIVDGEFSEASQLFDHCHNPNQLDASGLAPIHHLAMRFFSNMNTIDLAYKLLAKTIHRGADINSRSANGSTPLHYFLQEASEIETALRVTCHMMEAGAESLATNHENNTPFNSAINNHHLNLNDRLKCMNQMLMYMPSDSRKRVVAEFKQTYEFLEGTEYFSQFIF